MGVSAPADLLETVPTVFLLDLCDPARHFYTTKFAVRREDFLYVSNSSTSDLSEFLALVLMMTASAAAVRGAVGQ